MEGAELIRLALQRVNQILNRSLDRAPVDMLCRMPTPHTNSMAWLTWHLTRVQDDHISGLAGLPELWAGGEWNNGFGMDHNDERTGQRDSFEEVGAFKLESAETLLAYQDAAFERSTKYLLTLKPDDLNRELNEPQYDPLPTVGVRLVSVVSDNTQHAGQVAYLRGYFEKKVFGRA